MNRTFNSFELGDNVYELAGGLLPEIADNFDIELGGEPNAEQIGSLVGVLGKNKVLRENEEVQAISLEQAAEYVERSGVQLSLDRSLWSPHGESTEDVDRFVVTGAVANWQDRTAKLLLEHMAADPKPANAYLLAGNRLMDTASELANANIQHFQARYDELPTEAAYVENYVAPLLHGAGFSIHMSKFDFGDGDKIAQAFAAENPSLFDGTRITAARVANAGIQLACQLRKAIRESHPEFDQQTDPQMFVMTDSFPIARTRDEVANPKEFQSPFTALRQVALTAKMLVEAATSE